MNPMRKLMEARIRLQLELDIRFLGCPIKKAGFPGADVEDCKACCRWMRTPFGRCPCSFLPKTEVVKRYHRRYNYFEIPKWREE